MTKVLTQAYYTIDMIQRTAKSFGFEWAKFNDIFDQYESNFLSYIEPIDKDFFKDKLVLDAGCGAGRHSYFAAKYGARVVAIDSSKDAVISAIYNLRRFDEVAVLHDDINAFEFPQGFDYIFSLGVLHHLVNPEAGFKKLVSLLKEGGTISIWVYSKEDNKLRYLYEPLRIITTRIPHKVLYYLSYLPALFIEACNRLRLPLFSYYTRFPFRTKWNDAFDVFSAPSAKYYSRHDILKWFNDVKLEYFQVRYRVLDGKIKGIIGHGVK